MSVVLLIVSMEEGRRPMCNINIIVMICIRARIVAIVFLILNALCRVAVCVAVVGCWGAGDASAKSEGHAAQAKWQQQVSAY